MRASFFFVLPVMVITLFLSLPAVADKTEEVESLLKSRINEVLSVLGSAELSEEQKRERIMSVISPVIDFDLMSRLTLGRQNWSALTGDQQKRFVDLFVERLKNSYLDKTTLYTDQEVAYEKAVVNKDKVFVPTRILTDEKPVAVIYKFYPSRESWKVYDVEIEGVSFIRSYRAQFNEILRGGTVEDLFASLEEPAEEEVEALP